MNSTLNKIFIFSAGAAIGSVITWKMLESKYEQFVQDEIKAFKEEYAGVKKNVDIGDTDRFDVGLNDEPEKPIKRDRKEYSSIIENEGYNTIEKGDAVGLERPYTIEPDEYDTLSDYEAISLTYYADEVLADDMDNIVDDIDEIVGDDFADYFGEYEDDTVFIRNDMRKCDYEICRDPRKYSDVVGIDPHLTDDE